MPFGWTVEEEKEQSKSKSRQKAPRNKMLTTHVNILAHLRGDSLLVGRGKVVTEKDKQNDSGSWEDI